MRQFVVAIVLMACAAGQAEAYNAAAYSTESRGGEKYSLQQCVDTAYAHSVSLRESELGKQQKEILYQQAWHNLSPSIGGYVSENLSFGRATGVDNITRSQNMSATSVGVSAQMVLFDGLAMKFAIDEAKASKLASEANLEAVKRNLALNITAMYLDVLLKKELVNVAASQLEDTGNKVKRMEELVDAGRMPAGELYALQAQGSREEHQLLQAKNDVKIALLNLTQAMDIAFTEDFDIVVPTEEELEGGLLPHREEVWETALQHRPEIREAEYSLQSAEASLKGQKSAYSPSLSASAGVGTSYYNLLGSDSNAAFGQQLGDNFSGNVSLNLSIPLYDKMQTPNQVKLRKVEVENARLRIESVKKDLRKEIDQAYYNAEAAQAEKISSSRAERSAVEAERYASEKYEAGRGTAYEYNAAKQTLLQARSEGLQARYNYLFKVRILEYYMGL